MQKSELTSGKGFSKNYDVHPSLQRDFVERSIIPAQDRFHIPT